MEEVDNSEEIYALSVRPVWQTTEIIIHKFGKLVVFATNHGIYLDAALLPDDEKVGWGNRGKYKQMTSLNNKGRK